MPLDRGRWSSNKGEWTASLDLMDAYLQGGAPPFDQGVERFAYQGVVYQFRVLPFRISVAPYVFTRVASQLSKFVQWPTICNMATSVPRRLAQQPAIFPSHTRSHINQKKSALVPTQQFKTYTRVSCSLH